jgi:HEAT repeat protein
VREQAIFWLANVPTDEAADMLIDLAKGTGEMDLRKRAVYALSRSKSPKAASTLRDIAGDANAPVELRGDALNWYMSGPGKSMDDPMSFLKDVYGKADDQRFKERVILTIAQRRTDASREFLFAVAQNQKESLETRRTVVGMFPMMNVTGAQIASVYERTSEVEVKRQLLSALGQLGSRNRDGAGTPSANGVDQLLEIARNEKNLELRKQAIAQLSRSKDPRALALLQEIIER